MSSLLSTNKANSLNHSSIATKYMIVVFKDGKPIPPQDYVVTDQIPSNAYLVKEIDSQVDGINQKVSMIAIVDDFQSQSPNVKNMVKVLDGVSKYALYKANLLPTHIKQQFEDRMINCQPCIDNKKCLICGCKTPEKLFTVQGCPNSIPLIYDEQEYNNQHNNEKSIS